MSRDSCFLFCTCFLLLLRLNYHSIYGQILGTSGSTNNAATATKPTSCPTGQSLVLCDDLIASPNYFAFVCANPATSSKTCALGTMTPKYCCAKTGKPVAAPPPPPYAPLRLPVSAPVPIPLALPVPMPVPVPVPPSRPCGSCGSCGSYPTIYTNKTDISVSPHACHPEYPESHLKSHQ